MTVPDALIRAYQILELQPGSSFEEVRRAYLDLVQVWHPDRFTTANARLKSTAQEKFLSINDAYTLLKHQEEGRRPGEGPNGRRSNSEWRLQSQGELKDGLALASFQFTGNATVAYGYVDAGGRTVIGPRFSDAGHFSEGLAAVRLTGTLFWGYIDRSGSFVIEPQYVYAGNFTNGRARVSRGGPLMYIDRPA